MGTHLSLAGGPLTVTDANLCLGRLLPSHFPHIFGPDEKQPLSHKVSLQAFQALTAEVKASGEARADLSVEEVAMGFILVANEAMCRPIRALTQVPAPPLPCPCSGCPRKAPAGLHGAPHTGAQRAADRDWDCEQRPSALEATEGLKSAGNKRLL